MDPTVLGLFVLGLVLLVIGLTVVAFGTSAPELAVTVQAELAARPTSPSATSSA